MKIAFWSPLHGTGTTSSLLAIATCLSGMGNRRIAVTQTHYNLNNLENPLLGAVENGDFFRDTGVDAVIRHFKSGNITEEHILNCSIKINETLYLLAGTKTTNRQGFENSIVRSSFLHILSVMENYFDIVLIDTNSGNNEFSMKVIEECDAAVVSLRQNRYMLDSFFESGILDDKKVFYLFSDYSLDSKYSLHNLRHLYKEMKASNSAYLPHNPDYMDSISDEKVMKYISVNLDTEEDAPEYDFFRALKETVGLLESFMVKKI